MSEDVRGKIIFEIGEGLKENPDDPIGWLSAYVETIRSARTSSIISDGVSEPGSRTKSTSDLDAIVVDCGTGETKVLQYSFTSGRVSFRELTKLKPARSFLDEPGKFVDTVRYFISQYEADTVLVSASEWMRSADEFVLEKGNALLLDLMEAGVVCKILEPTEEAWFEAAAVEFASEQLGLNITSTWAAGAGSTQFTQEFSNAFTFPLGNEVGRAIIDHGEATSAEVWIEKVTSFYSDKGVQMSGRIACISATTYAAVEAGIALNQPVSVKHARDCMHAYVERRKRSANLTSEDARNLANVAQQFATLNSIFDESAELVFLRDLNVAGSDFRVTWSAGWFLHLLREMRVIENESRALSSFYRDMLNLGKTGNSLQGYRNLNSITPTAIGQVLVDLQDVIELLFSRAKATETKITPLLRDFASTYECELSGLAHRFKSKDSLERKLTSRLRSILESNKRHPLYIPKLPEVIHEVDDVLRYTLVCSTGEYVGLTERLVEALKKTLGAETELFSFWEAGSTYFGVNIFVTMDNFTFEIQMHTNESWDVKQNESHQVYEGFRNLENNRARLILYGAMKEIWNTVPIPYGVERLTKPVAMLSPIMEKFDQVNSFKRALTPALQRPSASGLCFRLIRGSSSEAFEYLAYPHSEKRLAWIAESKKLDELLATSASNMPTAIAASMGKPLDWVKQKLSNGDHWKLVILPSESGTLATWSGCMQTVQLAYPEIASKLALHRETLIASSFDLVSESIPEGLSFRQIKDQGESCPYYMNLDRMIAMPEPSVWQVRGFLYNTIGVNEHFSGDGFTYNELGERQSSEYLIPNEKISDIPGAELITLYR